jgi:hypothetical protein
MNANGGDDMSTLRLGKGFIAEFEDYGDTNNCYIMKGNQSNSLQIVQDYGCIGIEEDEEPTPVPDSIVAKALAWAESLGY